MSIAMGEQQDQQSRSFGGIPARSAATINETRIAIRNLDFFYGDSRASSSASSARPAAANRRCCVC